MKLYDLCSIKCGGVNLTAANLFHLNNSSSNIQSQINNTQSKFHLAFQAYGTGSVIRSYGQNSIATGDVDTSGGVGNYKVTMPSHPNGVQYGVFVTCNSGTLTYANTSTLSSTQITILTFSVGGTATNSRFTCHTID